MIATLLLVLALQEPDGPIRTAPPPETMPLVATTPATALPPAGPNAPFDWSAGARRDANAPRPAVLDYDREGRLITPPPTPVSDDDEYINPWAGVPGAAEADPNEGGYSRSQVVPVAPEPAPSGCRRVTERSQDGTRTSTSVVCGSGNVDALLDAMEARATAATMSLRADCDRPLEGEDTPRWVARCGSGRP